jgi:hypothetical protein
MSQAFLVNLPLALLIVETGSGPMPVQAPAAVQRPEGDFLVFGPARQPLDEAVVHAVHRARVVLERLRAELGAEACSRIATPAPRNFTQSTPCRHSAQAIIGAGRVLQ